MGKQAYIRWLSESDVRKCLDFKKAVRIAEEVLLKQGQGQVEMPPKQLLNLRKHGINSYVNTMPCYLKHKEICGIKWGGGFSDNVGKQDLPFMIQTILLASPINGLPLAAMSASWITSLKTGSETAIAGKYLAVQNKEINLSIIGVGDQGKGSLGAWLALHELGDVCLKEIDLVDLDKKALNNYINGLDSNFKDIINISENVEDAIKKADVIVTATHAEEPILKKEWLKEGVFIASLGSYPETDPEAVLSADKLVVDNWEQNLHRGAFQFLIEDGKIKKEHIVGELPDIVAGKASKRESDNETIIASLIGLGSIDIGLAYEIWQNAEKEGIGNKVTYF